MTDIDMKLCKRDSKVPHGVQRVFAIFEPLRTFALFSTVTQVSDTGPLWPSCL